MNLTCRVAPSLPSPDRRGEPSAAQSTAPSAFARASALGSVAYSPVVRWHFHKMSAQKGGGFAQRVNIKQAYN